MNPVSEIDIVIRLCLSFLAGGIIGFERSSRRQVAGLRTHILISLGATCLMLLSIWLPKHLGSNADPGRIAAQVVSGMGFLGAGAIIRLGNNIKGLTTAASLWLIAAIGLTIGAGMYLAALTTEILAIITLVVLNKMERKIFPDIKKINLEINYNHSDEPNTETILETVKNFNIENHSMEILQGKNKRKTKVNFTANVFDTVNIPKLVKTIENDNDIEHVEVKDNFNQ